MLGINSFGSNGIEVTGFSLAKAYKKPAFNKAGLLIIKYLFSREFSDPQSRELPQF